MFRNKINHVSLDAPCVSILLDHLDKCMIDMLSIKCVMVYKTMIIVVLVSIKR